MKRIDDGWMLPDEIDPPRTGVCVHVPDDANHRRAFLGALYQLTYSWNWQRDAEHTAAAAGRVWLDIWQDVAEKLGVIACEEETVYCREYPADASFVNYYPNDPRYTPDLIPDGYIAPPWHYADQFEVNAFGAVLEDVITTINQIPVGSLPTIIPASGFPRARINVHGAGIVRVYCRTLIAGSMLQTTMDDDILTLQFEDMNKDIISAPPETGDTNILEFEIPDDEHHHIDLIVVSKINDEFPFIYHGAALYKIQLCGPVPDLEEIEVPNEVYITINNIRLAVTDLKTEMRGEKYDGTPTSINIYAPEITFTNNDGEQTSDEAGLRATALCLAVRQYVNQSMYDAYQLVLSRAQEPADAAAAQFLLNGIIAYIVGIVVLFLDAAKTVADILDALNDSDAMDDVVCALYSALNGREISQAEFTAAINGLAVAGEHQATIVEILQLNAAHDSNWHYMLDLMGASYNAAQAGAAGDCCQPDWSCEGWVDLRAGVPPGVNILAGTWVPGVGVTPTHDDGVNKIAVVEYVLPEPCETTAYMKYRHNAVVGSFSPAGMVLSILSDAQAGLCAGGIVRPISGWSSALAHTPACINADSTVFRLYQKATMAAAGNPASNPIVGFWWSSDNVNEPYPFE